MSTTPAPLFTQISTLSRINGKRLVTVAYAVTSTGEQVLITVVITEGNTITHTTSEVRTRDSARTLYREHLNGGFLPVAP